MRSTNLLLLLLLLTQLHSLTYNAPSSVDILFGPACLVTCIIHRIDYPGLTDEVTPNMMWADTNSCYVVD